MNGIDLRRTSRKWLVIHGHFYQPPRENPWLGEIETQESAAPFHDWNERIYSQCYRPNAYSRMLDKHGMITGVTNNYEYLSFNFGPTLVSWLSTHHPVTFGRIVAGDKLGAKRCSGRGNALAQVYNHIIMPLASRRDKLTQIRWAKDSFKKSFGREPRGMWLAETAINMETVACLIEERISFIVLSPNQAQAFRPLRGHTPWKDTAESGIDTRRPYRLFAADASGKKTGGHLDVFFFDEGLSKEISFNGLLQDANAFGNRINDCYSATSSDDEVVVIATDGETFGHHKPFADMCLAYFFRHVAPLLDIQVVNFDHFRTIHPPRYEVSIKNAFDEGTAWSCAHGVGRWIRDCGCNTGGQPGWNQKWRTPLRDALDALQKRIDTVYVKASASAGVDPWALRDWYVERLQGYDFAKWKKALQRIVPNVKGSDTHLARLRRLLEAQKYMLFSFTSCGWFFSELSGIEPMQNLAFACRALQLGVDEPDQEKVLDVFLTDLARANSNLHNDTGETLFRRHILPYFHHNHMMAFVAVVEKNLGMVPGTVIREYGYACRVEHVSVKGKGSAVTSLHRVSIVHERYGCTDGYYVSMSGEDTGKPCGRVLRTDVFPPGNPPNAEMVSAHGGAVRFILPAVFSTLRDKIAGQYLRQISKTSYEFFNGWFRKNEHDLESLCSINTSLPLHFEAPVGFVLQEQWNTAFTELTMENVAAVTDRLALIYGKSMHFKVKMDLTLGAACCEKLLTDALDTLKDGLDAARCDAMRMLMDITDRYSLPVSKHRLEDILYPVLTGPVHDLYRETPIPVVRGKKKTGVDKWVIVEKLLKFAERMNFNVDNVVRS